MTIEYDCNACGDHVINFGRDTAPESGMCVVCEWLAEHIPDPMHRAAARRRIEGKATGDEP